ncbi:MAG: GTPase [Marmoricola sp.]
MSTLVQGARRVLSRRSGLDERVAGLGEAVEACRGRLDEEELEPSAELVERSTTRLRLSSEHTVVALAGATGSGKSSTFNALTGLELSSVGLRRPTTSWATACIWGSEGAQELLEWLGIPPRHQVVRDSILDTGHEGNDLNGLLLLDLPDHDSTEVGHHLEVDRLVQLTDLMVWVLDPQKYADAVLHERFLRPMAAHRDVMLVVLNHIDEIDPSRRESVLGDLHRLLEEDGLGSVPVLATSAVTGEGIDRLRAELVRRVADKATSGTRIATDVSRAADRLGELSGDAPAPDLDGDEQHELVDAVADAAGVPVVVDAVRRSSAARAQRATGWPLTAWLSRLRPDPLRRLHLDRRGSDTELAAVSRSSMPQAHPVQRARVEGSIRRTTDSVSEGLARPWAAAIRRASLSRADDLEDRLDRAMTTTDLGVARLPVWCRAVRVLQWLLLGVAVAGAVWLAALAVMAYLTASRPGTPRELGLPLPTWLLIGGVVLGLLLALLSRGLVRLGARARARRAERRLRSAVEEVARELVLEPVQAELAAYQRAREGLRRARGSRS